MRCFVAVPLGAPLHDLLQPLGRTIATLPGSPKVVPPADAHLTLAFLGEIDEHLQRRMTIALRGALEAAGPFEATTGQLGTFPLDGARARVIWLGLGPAEQWHALHRRVQSALLGCGVPVEEKFTPHVTLARLRTPLARETVLPALQTPAVRSLGIVSEVVLLQSMLTGRGPHYVELGRFSLRGAGPDPTRRDQSA